MNVIQAQYAPTVFDQVGDPGYVYPILICGMVFFMASNTMPMLLPEAQRVMYVRDKVLLISRNVAPWLLKWGFLLLIFAISTC